MLPFSLRVLLLPPFRRYAVAALLTLLSGGFVTLAAAGRAQANPRQISIMMDDDHLLYAPENVQRQTLASMASLGVNWVRATVLWSDVAHGTPDPRKDKSFDPTNPRTYPQINFADYDRLVTDARQFGIVVYFNITGPGPAWAMGKTKNQKLKKTYQPDPVQFGKFVQAVGTRYSGNYPYGKGNPANLPAMNAWSIWNEPNWPGWLAPQTTLDKRTHQRIPTAAILYRRLFFNARRGLDASGHTGDFVMLGETQPLGVAPTSESSQIRPGEFLRAVFCVDRRLRPLSGAAAKALACEDFKKHHKLAVSAYAHHPYTHANPPTFVDPNSDSYTLGNIGQLPNLLDSIAKSTHRLPSGLPIMVTEMGYSTNPPNPFRGVPLAKQLEYINESDYLAYQQPRVLSMNQFLLVDSPPVYAARKGSRAYWATFQTGLLKIDGSPKCVPGAPDDCAPGAYRLPIWVRSGRDSHGVKRLGLWAQVRFRHQTAPGDIEGVVFQYRDSPSGTWADITGVYPIAATAGFVNTSVPAAQYVSGGQIRAVWAGSVAPSYAVSRDVTLP